MKVLAGVARTGLALMVFASCGALRAQVGVSYPDTAPERGVSPVGSYTFDKLEAISKSSGVLTYKIPLTSMPLGRSGMSIPVDLTYNSSQFDYQYSYTYNTGTNPPQSPVLNQTLVGDPFGGWSINPGYSLYIESMPLATSNDCTNTVGVTRTSLVMPDGSRHGLQFYGFQQGFEGTVDGFYPWSYWGGTSCTNYSSLSGNVFLFTSDGTYIRVVATGIGAWTAFMPDGTMVTNTFNSSSGTTVQTIADRNGNKVTIQNGVITDDLGRKITITTPSSGGWQVTQTGFNGANLTWTFGTAPNPPASTPYTFTYYCVPSESKMCSDNSESAPPSILQVPSSNSGVPLTYNFSYYPKSGLLQSVTLPTGASTTYQYQCSDYTQCFNSFLQNAITGKQVTWYDQADGQSTQRTENWSYAYGNGASGFTFTKTAPDSGQEVTYLSGTSTMKIVEPDGSSTDYCYGGNRPYGIAYPQGASGLFNPWLLAKVQNVAASGVPTSSAVTFYTQDKNGNVLSSSSYDWTPYSSSQRDSNGVLTKTPSIPGSMLLQSQQNTYTVQTTQQAGTGAEAISDDPNAYWNAASPKFLHLLARIVTSGSGTGSAGEYTYDTNNSSISKANLTEERHWDSEKASSLPGTLSASNSDVTDYSYDAYGNLASVSDPLKHVTAYTYDSNNLYLKTKVQASGSSVARTYSYGWDFDTGLMTSKTDVDNNVETTYSYDPQGRQTNITEDSGGLKRQTNMTYDDPNRRVLVQRDQTVSGDAALATVTSYDELGRVALTQQFENPVASNPLPALSAGIKVQTRYLYSGSNAYKLTSNPYRATSSTAASSEQTMGWTLTAYDQNGRAISAGNYDGSGLPAPWGSNAHSFGNGVTSLYSSQMTTVTDQAGNARQTSTDALGRLASVVEDPGSSPHVGYTTLYGYDSLGDLTAVTQAAQTRSFAYDSMQRLMSATNPESGQMTYSYDSAGNLLTKTDARGYITCSGILSGTACASGYDALNRLTQKSYSNGTPGVTYTYDTARNYGKGQLGAVSNSNSTTTYPSYDPLGRVSMSSQTTAGTTYTFGYGYNLAGSPTWETYPSGRSVMMAYDGAGRVSQVSGTYGSAGTNYVSGVTYAAHGGYQSYLYGNSSANASGLFRQYLYNGRLQPSEMVDYLVPTAGAPANSVFNCASTMDVDVHPNYGTDFTGPSLLHAVLDLELSWGTPQNNAGRQEGANNGNLLGQLQQSCSTAGASGLAQNYWEPYNYDTVNRVTAASDITTNGTQGSRTMSYDQYGNMWVTGSSGYPLNPAAPTSQSQINAASNRLAATLGAGYDASGNLTSFGSGALAESMTYDAENRQTMLTDNGASTTYTYDSDGKRVTKTSGGVTTVFVYDAQGELAAEYGPQSVGGGAAACQTCYLSWDHLGSTRMVTDQAGNIVARHDFMPFGEEIVSGFAGRPGLWGDPDGVNQKFTGKERDLESGLDYFGSRYYGSMLGRFTSADEPLADQDPNDPQSWSLYSYVRNNPLRSLDPNGRKCVQTNNGPADDGTGGGCEAAGVSANGKITPQVFDVNDKGEMFTTISGVRNRVLSNGHTIPVSEPGLDANETANLLPFAKGVVAGGLISAMLGRDAIALLERVALALGGRIVGGSAEGVTVELATGGLVTFAAQKAGTNLTVDVSGAVAFGSTGNLFAIRQGLMAAAQSEGAETLTIVASKVGNEGLQSTLTRAGFESLGGTTFQGQSVQAFAKTFSVK